MTFTFNSSNPSTTNSVQYVANVTSQVYVSGNYTPINSSLDQVNLRINVLNEGSPALAKNFTLLYQNGTAWVQAGSPIITGLGTGSYVGSFTAETSQPNEPLAVSMYCQDERGITVGANVTCTNTQ